MKGGKSGSRQRGKPCNELSYNLVDGKGGHVNAGRHLVEGGVLKEGSNAAVATGTRAVAGEILSHPVASFVTRIGTGSGETAVRVFVGRSGGKLVGVAIADQAAGAVAKGQIVTTLILK